MVERATVWRVSRWVGGGVVASGAGAGGVFGLMLAETRLARRRIPIAVDPPPVSDDTTWAAPGVRDGLDPIELAVLGDSTAAGYGAAVARDTPAAQVALGVSESARVPVHVTTVAVVGAECPDLPQQITALGGRRPDLAVIMIGANDVVERRKPAEAVPYLEDTVRALRSLGAEVVVGTCPDLGTIRPLPQPLRAYARRLSRQLARAQTVGVIGAGGRTVSLGDLLGPEFMTHAEYFAEDRFHPSGLGYAEAARAVLPSALDALGLHTRATSASTFTTRRVKPLSRAAAQAAARPGTEVAAATRFGRPDNRRQPLARLLRRRRA